MRVLEQRRGTRACLQLATGEECGDEVEDGSKTSIGLFVAGCDASKCLEAAEQVLDEMAPFVHLGVMRDASGMAVVGGDNRCGAALIQIGAQPVAVEGLVADERLKIETCDQRLDTDAVVRLSGQKDEADKIAEGVDRAMILVVKPPRERPMA